MEHRKEARAGQAAEAGAAGLPLPVDPMDPPVEVLVGLVMEDVGVELLQQVDHTALLRVAVAVTVLEVTVTVEQPLLVVHTVLRAEGRAGAVPGAVRLDRDTGHQLADAGAAVAVTAELLQPVGPTELRQPGQDRAGPEDDRRLVDTALRAAGPGGGAGRAAAVAARLVGITAHRREVAGPRLQPVAVTERQAVRRMGWASTRAGGAGGAGTRPGAAAAPAGRASLSRPPAPPSHSTGRRSGRREAGQPLHTASEVLNARRSLILVL